MGQFNSRHRRSQPFAILTKILFCHLDAGEPHTRIVSVYLALMLSIKRDGPGEIGDTGDVRAADPIIPIFGNGEFLVKVSDLVDHCSPNKCDQRIEPVPVTEGVKRIKSSRHLSCENSEWLQVLGYDQVISVNEADIRARIEKCDLPLDLVRK
jgi:hypothetical protein